jgi:hypothetical protein
MPVIQLPCAARTKVVNLTGLTLHINNEDGDQLVLKPSTRMKVPRVRNTQRSRPPLRVSFNGDTFALPVRSHKASKARNMPPLRDGVVYVVVPEVAAAAPRDDLYTWGPVTYSSESSITCIGLEQSL